MSYGIKNIKEVIKEARDYEIVCCNDCWTYYYDELGDPRDDNCLALIWDEEEKMFFKGCPQCKTDACLADIADERLSEMKEGRLLD